MSAVIADPAAAGGAVPVKRGKKKLLIMAAAALAVALALGGGTVVYLKKKAHAAAEAAASDEDGGSTASAAPAEAGGHDNTSPPTYLPLDPFVVNLADREADRYAQVGITLEVESTVVAEQMRAYMPAIRNAILMVITRKSSRELLEPMGKEQLADEIAREAVRPMGIEIAAPTPVTQVAVMPAPAARPASAVEGIAASGVIAVAAPTAASGAGSAVAVAMKKKTHGPVVKNPIRHVHFSSFIIQ